MASDFDDDLEDDFEDEEFEDDDELEEADDDLVDDVVVDDEIIEDEEDEEEEEAAPAKPEEDEDVLDLEEELHPDDVEAPLDALLAERVTAGSLDDDDDDDAIDERGGTKVIPRRDTEFHCSSCFLVLPNHMLADKKKMLCRDCA
jgi:hypothetical protein